VLSTPLTSWLALSLLLTGVAALLVNREGKWRIMMERQLEATDEAGWNAVPR
jgi:hypothetical protein